MCIFNSKKDIETFIEKVVKIASEHKMPISNSAILLLKCISLYLHHQCWPDDQTLLSVCKLLHCCDSVVSQTIFETMLSFSDVNPEIVQAYEKFINNLESSQSNAYYKAVFECQSVIPLCQIFLKNKNSL